MNPYQLFSPLLGMAQPQAKKNMFHIPYLPILHLPNPNELKSKVYEAIVGEATAIEFYSRLLKEAPNELNREFIQETINDETKHLEAFSQLYQHLTGQQPHYSIKPVQYSSYKEGLLIAMKDELKAAHFYKTMINSNTDPLVRDTFFFAMVDELEHATQFGLLYSLQNK